MTIPVLKGWTFVTNVGQSNQAIVTKTAVPFERRQVTGSPTPEDVAKAINQLNDRVEEATRGARSVPFGAGGTVLVAVPFVNGVVQRLPHRLGTSNVHGFFGIPSSGVALATLSADDTMVTITPAQTFTADVYLTAFP